ncbi:hypothetical protein [Cupriavidus campinensis]|uniref:hypothetical protein n=1 Tax=Cupriavidus campinensis TaxID=151783 RepID=UPI0024E25C61|nr:hypothetical protein [Cupriavidus campinensis]
MQLQISTFSYSGDKPGLQGHGHVCVRGKGVDATFAFGGTFEVSQAEAEASAREFVAAADMLAALKAAVASLEQLAKIGRCPENMTGLRIGRAAIAKAEGKQ